MFCAEGSGEGWCAVGNAPYVIPHADIRIPFALASPALMGHRRNFGILRDSGRLWWPNRSSRRVARRRNTDACVPSFNFLERGPFATRRPSRRKPPLRLPAIVGTVLSRWRCGLDRRGSRRSQASELPRHSTPRRLGDLTEAMDRWFSAPEAQPWRNARPLPNSGGCFRRAPLPRSPNPHCIATRT